MAKIHTIDGVQYREVARDAKAGDFLLFEEAPYSFLTSGKVYKVTVIDSYGDPEIIDDEGDKIFIEEGYIVLEPVGAADLSTLESELAAMKAKVAEMERQLAEVLAQQKAGAPEDRLKVGDYAKIIADGTGRGAFHPHGFRIEEIVEVTIVYDDRVRAESIERNATWYVHNDDLIRATDEEVAEALRKLAQDKIQPGVYVKLQIPEGSRPKYGWAAVKNGDIGKVRERNGDSVSVDFPAQSYWHADINELVLVTEDERKQAEEAEKWAAIGREVGEFKVGDVVRVGKNYSGHLEGTIGVVVKWPSHFTSHFTCKNLAIEANGIVKDHSGEESDLTLIAPVESVVNLRGGDVA